MKNENIQVNNSYSLVKLDKFRAKHICSIDLKENESNDILTFLVSSLDDSGCFLHLITSNNNEGINNNVSIKADLIGELVFENKKFIDILDLKISKQNDINVIYCVLYDNLNHEYCLINHKLQDNRIICDKVLFVNKNQFSVTLDSHGKIYISTESEIFSFSNDKLNSEVNIDEIILKDRNYFICSSISQFNLNQIILSINNQILSVNLNKTNQIGDDNNKYKINYNAHDNRIICLKHLKLKAYLFCTSSMDNKIKFWDSREINTMFVISSMPHWSLDFSFHPTYNRLMIISSNSALVRLIIFESEDPFDNNIISKENSLIQFESEKKFKPNILSVDYNEFDESVFSVDWCEKDQWLFAAVSCNGTIHLNKIPEDIKFKVLIDSH